MKKNGLFILLCIVFLMSKSFAQQQVYYCPQAVQCTGDTFDTCNFVGDHDVFEFDLSYSGWEVTPGMHNLVTIYTGPDPSIRTDITRGCFYSNSRGPEIIIKTKFLSAPLTTEPSKWKYLFADKKFAFCDDTSCPLTRATYK
jgi:hypothetical protein